MKLEDYRYSKKGMVKLSEIATEPESACDKDECMKRLESNILEIVEYQEKLYAAKREGLIIILQAMDAGGKDSTIKKVTSGINPAGIDIADFKKPNTGDLEHDFLWRVNKMTPVRGKIAIYNRSYYEDVLAVQVHNLHLGYKMMPRVIDNPDFFERRKRDIAHFEQYLFDESYRVVKIFLHISKAEQKRRFFERLEDPDKNWKFDPGDLVDRENWDRYQEIYEGIIGDTATENSPWYVIPADKKWYSCFVVSQIILDTLKAMDPQYPILDKEELENFALYKKLLENEK